MQIPLKRKTRRLTPTDNTPAIDPASMALLMRAFREVIVKRLRAGWGPEIGVIPEGRFLVSLEGANAYLIGEHHGTGDWHVLVQGGRGTPCATSPEGLERIAACSPPGVTVHIYAQAPTRTAPANPDVEIHAQEIDPIRLIPDLYRKARANRALLQALQHLGKHV